MYPTKVIIIFNPVELGIVIGKTASNINKEDYQSYIHSYFLLLDLTDQIELQSI